MRPKKITRKCVTCLKNRDKILFKGKRRVCDFCKNLKVTKGGGRYRTRHLRVRINLVKERVDAEDIDVVYTNTKRMLADMATKLLQGALLRMLVLKVMGYD